MWHIHLILLAFSTVPQWRASGAGVYDYIVIGGGTAGSIVANRLTEDSDVKVLLLEAGNTPPLLAEIPGLFLHLVDTEHDWQYKTVPLKHSSAAFEDKSVKWPRGKMLGGSSSMNGLIYVRGNKNDFDNWEANGAVGWNWDNVEPYFRKAEYNAVGESAKHYLGNRGPLKITAHDENHFVRKAFVEAFLEMGYNLSDYNSGVQTGVSYGQSAVYEGQRQSTFKAYIQSVTCRENLKIVVQAYAEKILFDENKKAVGVIYSKSGEKLTARASREIIVSAGSVNTPQLLMLSGIGPKDHLRSLGIPVISNLPVGSNLQDHLMVVGPMFPRTEKSFTDTNEELMEYLLHRRGPLADTHLSNAFVSTKFADRSKDWPDIQFNYHAYLFSKNNAKCMQVFNGYNETIFKAYTKGFDDAQVGIFLPYVLRPHSRGFVRLRSKNPEDKPIIDPRYLEDERDLNVLIEGVKLGFQLGQTESFKKRGFVPSTNVVPGCESLKLYSDEYWSCFVRTLSTTIFHPVGTCRMGPSDRSTSVVDNTLKVIGVSGLRVIDASIMPKIVSGNTYAAVVMIGEKGSDLIKDDLHKVGFETREHHSEF